MKQRFLALIVGLTAATGFNALSLEANADNHTYIAEKQRMAEQKPITTSSGLQYEDMKVGTGASPHTGDKVTVEYTGWLTNGKKFDSSVGRAPFSFQLGTGGVIKGWDEGVASMKVGGKRKLTIPPNLAYGAQNVGGGLIPPNSTLVFEVELIGIN